MTEYKISYNPFTHDYIASLASHSIQIYNRGKTASFDEYIRCIIIKDVLYLRVYYPFNDLELLTRDKLYQASYTLLKENEKNILQAIKDKEQITIKSIKYNVDNDLLKGIGLINI